MNKEKLADASARYGGLLVQLVTKKEIQFTSCVCSEQIFDGLLFT